MGYSVEIEGIDALSDVLKDSFDSFLDDLTEEVELAWRREVATTLDKTRAAYFEGLSVRRSGDVIVLTIKGPLANAIENGSDSFDMKPGFLKGAASRIIPIDTGTATIYRTVTPQSRGWIHPGIEPRNFIANVHEELKRGLLTDVLSRHIGRVTV